jgi:hypothetical protein
VAPPLLVAVTTKDGEALHAALYEFLAQAGFWKAHGLARLAGIPSKGASLLAFSGRWLYIANRCALASHGFFLWLSGYISGFCPFSR